MEKHLSLLLPRPQHAEPMSTRFAVPDEPVISLASGPPSLMATAERLAAALTTAGRRPRWSPSVPHEAGHHRADITLRLEPAQLPQSQSYRLTVDEGGITVTGTDAPGLFYGVCTLIQLIRLHTSGTPGAQLSLPGLRIADWPDFSHRGVLLDVSRDKVPTMETLFDLVDLLASWKINQVQLYMEHTFAYRGHEVVWQHASPFAGDEVEALDAFCQARYVELVPNQNSFGHMHRWLIHEPYRRLAECPDGIAHPFSPNQEPYGLCPVDPGSLALLADLYDQLLPHFSSRQFNVGLDETFDLGQGRSAASCKAKGLGRVYLDFLKEIHHLVTQRGRAIQCWSDMLRQRPELIGELPKDIIVLEWGYEADHPFIEHSRLFRSAGLTVYVCPGTSSWNSLAGRTENALANLRSAATAGRATGAVGFLTTDWGDNGHLQPLPVSYLGLLAGAGLSWCSADAADPMRVDIPALLNAHAFGDQAGVMGRLAYDLGNTYVQTGTLLQNSSALFHLLIFADRSLTRPGLTGLTIESLEKTLAYVDRVMTPLSTARMVRSDAENIVAEFHWLADMLRLACRLGIARLQGDPHTSVSRLPAATRTALANELGVLIERHRELWRRRNRPGGLDDSARRLQHILTLLKG
ncbi:MAG: glycoside hydrolase family 20 zincin-like fold domain-containing protein [Candidatus Methylomirabilales bacterium]